MHLRSLISQCRIWKLWQCRLWRPLGSTNIIGQSGMANMSVHCLNLIVVSGTSTKRSLYILGVATKTIQVLLRSTPHGTWTCSNISPCWNAAFLELKPSPAYIVQVALWAPVQCPVKIDLCMPNCPRYRSLIGPMQDWILSFRLWELLSGLGSWKLICLCLLVWSLTKVFTKMSGNGGFWPPSHRFAKASFLSS